MAITHPTPVGTLSRAEGFLACLIWINSTRTIVGDDLHANPTFFQDTEQGAVLQNVYSQLEETRLRLVDATQSIALSCREDTLNSFVNPTSFYETAVSGFHNTLLGLPPTALSDVAALCAMSHAISFCLYSTRTPVDFEPFSNFDLWRNAISNHEHRQPFDDLIKAACLEPYLTALANIYPVPQYSNDMFDGALELSWDSDLIHPNFFLASENEDCSRNESSQAPDLQSLQGSSIVVNLSHFLEQCGDPLFRLFSRGAMGNMCLCIGTSVSSPAASVERLFMQILRDDASLKNPTIQGILSVVDRFVDLGCLQSADEMRDYLLLLGKGLLASDQIYLDFIQWVPNSMTEAANRISPLTGEAAKSRRDQRLDVSHLFNKGANLE
ncbi:hypothetical protein FVEN_g5569 [Fusarium venenatum]|uniref:Uncharacterized protein n=1 Tax=Fusarium venenatum TaxID=56646 RepID=A0A2L2U085_9HYPO|nr:uncharacterized protein FVRRES_08337 [Fusarium venenatum]KAG8356843.1 hypothetical protein FVEN_g5569 [Fusarium venenatum]KAH6965121.1 hypothetical protein EDB82DRAFT_528858 [Fusarium venenatum]CEI68260.1 unnamed protein product [Fusarium venenatum]